MWNITTNAQTTPFIGKSEDGVPGLPTCRHGRFMEEFRIQTKCVKSNKNTHFRTTTPLPNKDELSNNRIQAAGLQRADESRRSQGLKAIAHWTKHSFVNYMHSIQFPLHPLVAQLW